MICVSNLRFLQSRRWKPPLFRTCFVRSATKSCTPLCWILFALLPFGSGCNPLPSNVESIEAVDEGQVPAPAEPPLPDDGDNEDESAAPASDDPEATPAPTPPLSVDPEGGDQEPAGEEVETPPTSGPTLPRPPRPQQPQPPPMLIQSLSNKILEVEIVESAEDGDFLLLTVGTEIYASNGWSPACNSDFKRVVFRRDATNPADALQQDLIWQAAMAAKLGPFRVKFILDQNNCLAVPGVPGTCTVATGLTIISLRPL